MFSFLPGAGTVYRRIFLPSGINCIFGLTMIPNYGPSGFGPGWGLIITLSSFNKFKTNIKKSSWLIGLGQMLIMIALSLLIHLTERFFKGSFLKEDYLFGEMFRTIEFIYLQKRLTTITTQMWRES